MFYEYKVLLLKKLFIKIASLGLSHKSSMYQVLLSPAVCHLYCSELQCVEVLLSIFENHIKAREKRHKIMGRDFSLIQFRLMFYIKELRGGSLWLIDSEKAFMTQVSSWRKNTWHIEESSDWSEIYQKACVSDLQLRPHQNVMGILGTHPVQHVPCIKAESIPDRTFYSMLSPPSPPPARPVCLQLSLSQ